MINRIRTPTTNRGGNVVVGNKGAMRIRLVLPDHFRILPVETTSHKGPCLSLESLAAANDVNTPVIRGLSSKTVRVIRRRVDW